jgi:uncharacterized protein YbaP (TraB family)
MSLNTELKQLNALCFLLNAAEWKTLCAELAHPESANNALKRAFHAVPSWRPTFARRARSAPIRKLM